MTKQSLIRFLLACEKDDIEEVKIFVSSHTHMEIFEFDSRGWNSLILASYNHSINVLNYLLEFGGDANTCNYKGTSLLMYAKTRCLEGVSFDILSLLLNYGADINHRDRKNNWTILQYVRAIEANQDKLIKFLISNGARE